MFDDIIKPKRRMLKASWTLEIAQDLKAIYEWELPVLRHFSDVSIFEEISGEFIKEMDKELIENLNKGVKYV